MFNINRTYRTIETIDKFLKVLMNSIILSVLIVVSNTPLLLFIFMYNGPLDLLSGTVITVLSIMIFPAYTSALYAIRKEHKIIRNYIRFYMSKFKNNYKVSGLFTFILFVLIVDALFFKKHGYDLIYNLFLGLSVFTGLIVLNSGLLVSTFSMNLKKLFLMNIAYLKALSLSSFSFILIMLIPYRLDILIYLVAIGMAIIGQNYVYKTKVDVIRENITDLEIKYL